MRIRVSLFGQPRVLSADGSREFALPRKTLNVLAYLILHRRRAPTRDSIAFELFPDEEEEQARGTLRRNLSHLLNALPDGRQFVRADLERIAWMADAPAHVDVIAFEQALSDGRDADAIAEYAGQLLPTIYDEWTTADRERLRDAFHEALVRTIGRERSQRRFDSATALAHRLLDEDPWREDMVRQLIAIRYEAGDRAGALAVFERFAARLRDEMQAAPMPETVALRDAVLRGARLATSEPQRSAAVAVVEPGLSFVGRDAPMHRARACWQSAAEGRANVLFVSGEAGVGKSRFATELARLAESEGGLIVRGYTSAGGEHRPYEAFAEALHGAPGPLDDYAGATLTDDRAARLRLFDSVRRRLSDLSHARPVVLVLEDLHWARGSTIDLLEFVAGRLGHAPVLVVATFRSDELSHAHPLRALRRQLQGLGAATDLALDRLNAEDAMRAARSALPQTIDDAALARTIAWADGIPLLLVETVRDLAAGRDSNAFTMTALVGERFERLSASAETALAFGAVLGERFDLSVLAAVTGWRDDEIVDAIGESIECGLLRATSRAPGLAFAFTHDLIRVAATERISEQDRARAHGLVARAICAQHEDDGARAGEIARHFAAAGERLRAAEYLCSAARYALDVFANDDARERATEGLALCDERDPGQRQLRYELVALRENSLARIGALEERRADAHLLVSLADGDEATAIALERLFEAYRDDPEKRSETLKALSSLADSSERAAGIFAFASANHAFLEGEYRLARDASARAADGFDASGQHRAAMQARFLQINVLARLGAFAEGAAAVERLRSIVEASDDIAMRAEFYRIASGAYAEADREAALDDARRSVSLSLRIGDRFAEARARQNVAAIAGKLRFYQEAFDANERGLTAYRDVGAADGIRDTILNMVGHRLFCGDHREAERLLGEIEPDVSRLLPWVALRTLILRGVLDARLGHRESAESLLLETRRRAEILGAAYYRARSGVELATLLASEGRYDEAREYIDATIAVLPSLGQIELEGEAYALSSRLFACMGDAPSARDHFARAIAQTERIRMQAYSEIAWNAAAACALLGDASEAMSLAQACAVAAVEDALRMPADLAETYLRLPWHQHIVAFLWGRPVPLRLDGGA